MTLRKPEKAEGKIRKIRNKLAGKTGIIWPGNRNNLAGKSLKKFVKKILVFKWMTCYYILVCK